MKVDTVCRFCSACCPVIAEVKGGRLISAQRKSTLALEKRVQCPRLQSAADIVYSKDRLIKPLIREKNISGVGFRETSWEEALDYVAKKFQKFKRGQGVESIAWLRGMAADWGAPWDYANRLMNAFGSPNTIGNGSVCHVAREMAHVYTYGAMTVPQPEKAKCIIVWGKNDRNTAPSVFESIQEAKRRGTWLVVIDPVRTLMADIADIWMQIKPGRDGLLAMAMINEIINKGLYDKGFVENFSVGFQELKAAAAKFPADRIAGETWLESDMIEDVACLYARSKPACIIEGNGLDMQVQAFQATRSVCILRALTGNLDREGGDFIPQPVPIKNIQLKERVPKDILPVTHNYPLFNKFHQTWGMHAQSCLVDAILDEKPYPVKMLIVQSGNPAVTMTDSNRVEKALKKLEFLVVIDLFFNRTAKFAHVVLPASSCFEKTQLNRAYMRSNTVILQNQVIDCVGQSWPDWKITFELARHLGLEADFPWETVEQAIDYQLEPAYITVEMLREKPEGISVEGQEFEKFRSRGFATPSGKVEFFSKKLQENGYLPLPYIDGDMKNPLSFSEKREKYPFIGISGERSNRFTHTQFRNIPSLLSLEPEGFVDIHPEDAVQRNIVDRELLRIRTPRGEMRMKARISDKVHPGSIMIAWGWGEADKALGLNNLTDDEIRDPVTATPSNRSFMCRLEKLKEG